MKTVDIALIADNAKYDQVMIHHRIALSYPAQLAIELVKISSAHAWAAPTPAGEEQRFMTPSSDEVVARSVRIVELLYAEMERREWVKETPPLEEMLSERSATGFRNP